MLLTEAYSCVTNLNLLASTVAKICRNPKILGTPYQKAHKGYPIVATCNRGYPKKCFHSFCLHAVNVVIYIVPITS